jgi:predicted nucleic acid-binding protein
VVAIDTDVLILAFAFQRDPRQPLNEQFLNQVQNQTPIVAIYTVMELLGKLSFNLSSERLAQWQLWLQERWQLTVIHPRTTDLDTSLFFQQTFVDRPFRKMQEVGISYLDVLILNLIEESEADSLVTWNARHFRHKTALPVFTPAEYLQRL